MLTREEAKGLFKKSSDFAVYYFDHTEVVSLNQVDIVLNQIYNEHEAQMKAKDEEIERLKAVIDTSIEEIEYAIKKPQYAEVYLDNAIRFLKDNV